jgi:DNA polymerase-1
MEADGSQLELRVMGWLANEPTLLAAYREGRDIHMETARDVMRIANPTKGDRSKAKRINFGYLYKMGPPKFVYLSLVDFGLHFTLEEAEDYQRRFFAKFKGLPAYYLKQEAEARRTGEVRTPFGRVRHLPGITSPAKEIREEAVRQAVNTPTQATASDLNTLAILEGRRRMPWATFLLPYHDASLWEVPQEEGERSARIMIEIWRNYLPVVAREKFKVEITVPLDAEAKIGERWGDMHEVKP